MTDESEFVQAYEKKFSDAENRLNLLEANNLSTRIWQRASLPYTFLTTNGNWIQTWTIPALYVYKYGILNFRIYFEGFVVGGAAARTFTLGLWFGGELLSQAANRSLAALGNIYVMDAFEGCITARGADLSQIAITPHTSRMNNGTVNRQIRAAFPTEDLSGPLTFSIVTTLSGALFSATWRMWGDVFRTQCQ